MAMQEEQDAQTDPAIIARRKRLAEIAAKRENRESKRQQWRSANGSPSLPS